MNKIFFITRTGNDLFSLELAKTLLQFIEYDFTYFWEQVVDYGKTARKTGKFDKEQSKFLKSIILECHPFYEAKINTRFNNIALDCILEYYCRTNNIGLEALWTQYISPKNSYETAVFSRISEYKSGKAVNEWVNIIRLQQYARKKLSYIFDGEICSVAECMARNKYFDLGYSVSASEIGYPQDELPMVECYPLGQMPNAVFILKKVAKDIFNKLNSNFNNLPQFTKKGINDDTRDSYSLDAYEYMKDLSRPTEMEFFTAIENFRYLPDVVYLPNTFKAIIDLEFLKMFENSILLQKCASCGRYFIQDPIYTGKFCNRVTKSGLTCREEQKEYEAEEVEESSFDIYQKTSFIYENLKKQVGVSLPESEFNDWSEYLERLKKNVTSQNATLDELESFLNYTEKMYGELKV